MSADEKIIFAMIAMAVLGASIVGGVLWILFF